MPFIIGVNPTDGRKKPKRKKRVAKKRAPAKPKRPAARIKKNPVAKTAAVKRSKKTMPKKRKARKAPARQTGTRTKTIVKYRTRARRAAYRVKKAYKSGTENLDVRKILRGSIAAAAGMIIAKVAVNKLTSGGSETERWSWPNIAMAAGSSIAIAFALGAIFKLKKPTVEYVALGGGALAVYKAITCKLAPKWGWSESWFGEDEPKIHPDFLGAGAADEFEVIDYSPSTAQPVGYIPGMGATGMGGKVVNYNPNLGATGAGGRVVSYNPNLGGYDTGYDNYTM